LVGVFEGDVAPSTQLSKCVVFTQLEIALPDELHDEQVVESQVYFLPLIVWATPDVVAPHVSPACGAYAAAGKANARMKAQLNNEILNFGIVPPSKPSADTAQPQYDLH